MPEGQDVGRSSAPTEKEFKYDVAFSFMRQDEALATKLNDLLQDRLNTFLYSKRQEELAGKDGEIGFNEVFGRDARLVVVFYRKGWGETPWTRIEQTAIRNRAFGEGWDFTFFIPLDDPPTVPQWVPKAQIWFDLPRWGTDGAAPLIERRAHELGSKTRAETVGDRAARLKRAIQAEQRRQRFLESVEGVKAADAEVGALYSEIQQLASDDNFAGIGLQVKVAAKQLVIVGPAPCLGISWRSQYSNTLAKSMLTVAIWSGHPPFPKVMHFEEPRPLAHRQFSFDLNVDGQCFWREIETGRSFDTRQLAEFCLKYHMDELQKKQTARR